MQTRQLLGLIGEINVKTREDRDERDARIAKLEADCAALVKQVQDLHKIVEALVWNLHEAQTKRE